MSDTVIKVENLSKRYVIGHQRQERYSTLRDAIANGASSLKQRFLHPTKKTEDPCHEEFWALKDVSFEIKQGDRVGIIGRNGAGKSTLLKILSRITEPTSGKISIKGRVASLLEVGTGFHPELTGRENIFLNGAILGMSQAEIKKKFDEIVDFAEVEKFLDTPVKFYSSGMYVRLAFAVAAHLEPEILIVDEVLAVGDAAFQKKCLGKMGDVAEKDGRTVLFVSHNMAAIKSLCSNAIWINEGMICKANRSVESVINEYLKSYKKNQDIKSQITENSLDTLGNEYIKIKNFRITNIKNECIETINIKTDLTLEFEFLFLLEESLFYIGCHLQTISGENAFVSSSRPQYITRGLFKALFHIPSGLLNNHHYIGHIYWVKDGNIVLYRNDDLVSFEVSDTERYYGEWMGEYLGVVRPQLNWDIQKLNDSK